MNAQVVIGALAILALSACASNYGHWDGERTKVRVRLGDGGDRYILAEYAEFLAAFPDGPHVLIVADKRVPEFLKDRVAVFVADPDLLLRPGHYVIAHQCGPSEVFNVVNVEASTKPVVLTAQCD